MIRIVCIDTEDIICPNCGNRICYGCNSSMENDDIEVDWCDVCGKDFKVYCEVRRTFSTVKLED